MIPIKPIETKYSGYLFRSRLEARYAVFLDNMGVRWEYEMEGYELPSGYYLPDFYLYDFDIFLEVKPLSIFDKENENDFIKAWDKLCDLARGYKSCAMTIGLPQLEDRLGDVIFFVNIKSELPVTPPVNISRTIAIYSFWQYCVNKNQVVLAGDFAFDIAYYIDPDMTKEFTRFANFSNGDRYDYSKYRKSLEAAKSARF